MFLRRDIIRVHAVGRQIHNLRKFYTNGEKNINLAQTFGAKNIDEEKRFVYVTITPGKSLRNRVKSPT